MNSSKNSKINLMSTLIFIGTVTTIVYTYIIVAQYFNIPWPFNMPLPYDTFLNDPEIFGNDFTRLYHIAENFMPYKDVRTYVPSEPVSYGPFAFVLYATFSLLNIKLSMIVFYSIFILSFLMLNIFFLLTDNKIDSLRNVFVFTFLSYPFLYLIDRGNSEGYVFILISLGTIFYYKNQLKLSSVFYILATAIKPYAGIFFLLYLKNKQYKELIYSLVGGILFCILCYSLFEGNLGEQIAGFFHELRMASKASSGISLSRLFAHKVVAYNFFSFLIVAFSYYIISSKKIDHWKELMIFVILMILIPAMSYDYKLLHLYVPLYFFVNSKETTKFDIIYSLLFVSLLMPKNYIHFINIHTLNIILLVLFYILILIESHKMSIMKILMGLLVFVFIGVFSPYVIQRDFSFGVFQPAVHEHFIIDFSELENKNMFRKGWGVIESDGENNWWRWAEKKTAVLRIKFDPEYNYKMLIFVGNHSNNKNQNITISLWDVVISECPISQNENKTCEVFLSKKLIKNKEAKITFDFSENNYPDKHTKRNLAIAFGKIEFFKIKD